jgi:hypothetical protein
MRLQGMEHEIYLRCHTRVLGEESNEGRKSRNLSQFPGFVLAVDCETSLHSTQSLNFGVYQFCERNSRGIYRCLEEGLFYADDLDEEGVNELRLYVRNANRRIAKSHGPKLKLLTRAAFVEKVLYTAIQTEAMIVAFNLPFDLSRIAVEYRIARGAGGRGWSFIVFRYRSKKNGEWLPNTFRPRIQLRPKDSKAAFIRLASGDMNQPYRLGRFLDLKTTVWALRNRNLSLDAACHEFKVPGKLDHIPSGKVTPDEIDYCRQDVSASVGLLNALISEFRSYPLGNLPPEKAYSAASIAKAFLANMGVLPPEQKFRTR